MRSLRPCSDSSATPSFPSQPEGKIGLPRANPRGRPPWLRCAGPLPAPLAAGPDASPPCAGKRGAGTHHARGEGERVLALESREGTRASPWRPLSLIWEMLRKMRSEIDLPGSPGTQPVPHFPAQPPLANAKDSALLSSRDAGLLEPPERPQVLPPLEMRLSSIAPNPVESREAPPNSTVPLNSQRHPENLHEVTGTCRGNPVESREAPPNSTVPLTSQRHPEKLHKVTGTCRGNPVESREAPPHCTVSLTSQSNPTAGHTH